MSVDKYTFYLILAFVIRISVFQVKKDAIGIDPYTAFQILAVFIIMLLMFLQRTISFKLLLKYSPSSSLVFVYILGVISTLWSALPFFSFYMALQNLILLYAFQYLLLKKASFEQIERFFIKIVIIFISIEFVSDVLIYSGFSFLSNWHNLETGGMAGMLFCYSFAEFVRHRKSLYSGRRKLLRNITIISFIILIFSTSSGSNVAALGGLLSIMILSKNPFFKILFAFLITPIILFPELIEQLSQFVFPNKDTKAISSFGYRLHLWESFWDLIKEKPYIGWGYATIERIGDQYNIDAHNSLIGIIGGLGIVGGTIFIYFIITYLWTIWKKRDIAGISGVFAGSTALIINSNTFGFLSSKATMLTLGFFLISGLFLAYTKVVRKNE